MLTPPPPSSTATPRRELSDLLMPPNPAFSRVPSTSSTRHAVGSSGGSLAAAAPLASEASPAPGLQTPGAASTPVYLTDPRPQKHRGVARELRLDVGREEGDEGEGGGSGDAEDEDEDEGVEGDDDADDGIGRTLGSVLNGDGGCDEGSPAGIAGPRHGMDGKVKSKLQTSAVDLTIFHVLQTRKVRWQPRPAQLGDRHGVGWAGGGYCHSVQRADTVVTSSVWPFTAATCSVVPAW